ncbi:MAG: hypothetical protein WD396_00485 [Pseudohongiellaceae bacterium]
MLKKWLLLLTMSLLSGHSVAELVVNRSIVIYDDPASVKEDVVVINSDSERNLYVQVDAYRVMAPGSVNEELLKIVPDVAPEFLVSPNKLVVPPSARNLVRFLDLAGDRASERVYRVNLIPVTPPVELEDTGEGRIASRLEVVVAYQVLAIVLPHDPQPELSFSGEGGLARFGNTGNANYLLTDGQQCNPADPADCRKLQNRRVYPGNEWTLSLPFDGPFTYKVKTHNGLSSRQFDL